MNIIKAIYNFLGETRRVYAAANLAHSGDHAGALKLMMADFKGWI